MLTGNTVFFTPFVSLKGLERYMCYRGRLGDMIFCIIITWNFFENEICFQLFTPTVTVTIYK